MEDTEKKNASTSKIAAEKEVSKEISPNDIYDRIFKRILTLSGKAVINLINGLFETCYSENSILTYNWTEFETDKLRKILADGIITVNGTDAFHFEAEISDDNIIFRMLEYGFHHGLRTMKTIIDPETNELSYRFSFPRQVIIYLDSAEKIPDEQIIQIDFGYQGSFTYKVPVVHFQKEKPETIKKMICTLFTGQPVRRVYLCAIVMNSNENVLKCIVKGSGPTRLKVFRQRIFIT